MSAGPYSIGSSTWPGLAKLAEECGELIQVIGKIIALDGAENYDHWGGTNVKQRLVEEMADVLAAAAFVTQKNLSREQKDEIQYRLIAKQAKFNEWHRENG